ncbi:hypothetical protein FZEAL_4568 [Fusarium zealandicum]|uniref:Uncharacterized protein n=1 Tax=Fusarium zealandicum TaxID=1053134 RepID=A0A8H4XKP5_9HYPO|nr:hypothetical protein FZEAL_4568 [Fusarium zealandicum]
MSDAYKVTVKNRSGASQNYSFFAANPVVAGGASGRVWSNVMRSTPDTPNDGKAVLELPTSYYAICGSYEGSPETQGRVSISKTVPIDLGTSNGDSIAMGSTVNLIVNNRSACDFEAPVSPGDGKIGSFVVNTTTAPGKEFTTQDAVNNHLLVGIAHCKDDDLFTAMATFTPQPNSQYQIMPQAIVYVAAGPRLKAGQVVMHETLVNTIAVDFKLRGDNEVVLSHNNNGEFKFEDPE